MISRRNFFSICIMMAVLLFMFQFSQVFKAWGSNYDVNEYLEKMPASGKYKWEASYDELTDKNLSGGDYILFLGEKDGGLWNIVEQWCTYTKRNVVTAPNTRGWSLEEGRFPEMILIDSGAVNFSTEMSSLIKITQYKVPVVFCNLPDVSVVKKDDRLQELLGIRRVKADTVDVEGVQMYSGFFLGGEALYKAEKKEEEKLQDLNLTIPWYATGKGTKTYMVGLVDDEDTEREDFPSLIWRNSYDGTPVFVVCGDYMSELTGLGILDAFVYESNSYAIYPIVNASNVVVADYPVFASENGETMRQLYGRDMATVLRDIMWPGISAMAEQNKLKMTCCIASQWDYGDGEEPVADDEVFYLQQMKEIGAEAGRSLIHSEEISLLEKLERDSEFYGNLGGSYCYGAAYLGEEELQNASGTKSPSRGKHSPDLKWDLEEGYLKDIRTLACSYSGNYPILSYYTDEVTLQCIMGEATEYSYSRDLQSRSIATALGYSNVLVDMHNVLWPRGKEDQWEHYFDEVSSNVSTYWNKYKIFSKTTLSESDARVRAFLNLDYKTERIGDKIYLSATNSGKDAWFLLRTHGEDIAQAQNAEYEKIENDVYLIHALSDTMEFQMETSKEVPQFLR